MAGSLAALLPKLQGLGKPRACLQGGGLLQQARLFSVLLCLHPAPVAFHWVWRAQRQPRAVLFHPDGPWCPAMEKKLGRGPEKELKAATQLFSRARAGEGVGVGERRFEWNFVWVVATGRIFLFASRLGSGGWEEGQKQVGLGRPQRPEANFCLWGRVAMTQNEEHPGAHVFAAGSVTPV